MVVYIDKTFISSSDNQKSFRLIARLKRCAFDRSHEYRLAIFVVNEVGLLYIAFLLPHDLIIDILADQLVNTTTYPPNVTNSRSWHDAVVYIYDMVTKPRPKPAPRHPGVFLPNVCSNKHTGNNA
ncbi:hypothetical protein Y71_21290 [Kosakonia radicincitans DSM 16656]|nr:hypothetical protein Y71_21290 [Kosakonia radicincitans DSM 16656]